MANAHTSHEFWNLRDSLRRAKARADRYFKEKRLLQTKVRDLERSRDLWKLKLTQLVRADPTSAPFPPPP